MSMDEMHALLSRNLKTLRAYRHMTQENLAEMADLSKNYIAEIETGRKYPSPEAHLKLARALGVRPYHLLLESASESTVLADPGLRDMLVHEVSSVINRLFPDGGAGKPGPQERE